MGFVDNKKENIRLILYCTVYGYTVSGFRNWGLLCSWCIVFSQIFPKMSHRRVKVSVNKRDTSRFQRRASTRPPEPTVGEYSSLLIKSFWLQCGRSEGLFLWPAGLQRNYSGLFGSCELEGRGSMIIFFQMCSFHLREYLLCPWWLYG